MLSLLSCSFCFTISVLSRFSCRRQFCYSDDLSCRLFIWSFTSWVRTLRCCNSFSLVRPTFSFWCSLWAWTCLYWVSWEKKLLLLCCFRYALGNGGTLRRYCSTLNLSFRMLIVFSFFLSICCSEMFC